jgi:hypothetical protein
MVDPERAISRRFSSSAVLEPALKGGRGFEARAEAPRYAKRSPTVGLPA